MEPTEASLRGYLTLVPRGLEHVASSVIERALTSSSYACEDLRVLTPAKETQEYIDGLSDKLRKQQRKKRMKEERRKKWMDSTSTSAEDSGNNDDDAHPFFGTLQSELGEQISLGHDDGRTIFCKTGPNEGVLPLQFYTDAPPAVVASIRGMGCGPLLALIASSHHNEDSTVFPYEHTGDDAISAAESFVGKEDKTAYLSKFHDALSVWFDHAKDVWFADYGFFYGLNMEECNNRKRRDTLEAKRRGDLPLSFRVSCTRTHSKRYKHWKREDIMKELSSLVAPSDDLSGKAPWEVDLKKHDLEVLAIIHDTALTIAIELRPYQLLHCKTWSNGKIPPDILPPYISGLGSSEDIVRLRPSTAALLLHLAQVKSGDVVLDPCAGLGTIPIESSLASMPCVGIGGDVALKVDSFARIATKYLSSSNEMSLAGGTAGAADLVTWDAALLPIRDGIVDCIVSDLPFGSKCLSSKKLSRFLPLLLSECARVLRPQMGRCILLCGPGSYQTIVHIIQQTKAFQLPCSSIFPANIGGLVAWIVIVQRGEGKHVRSSDHRGGVRTIAGLSKQQQHQKACQEAKKQQTGKAKFRRVQAY